MSETDAGSTDGEFPARPRYDQFNGGDAVVVYDRHDTARWIQSDLSIPLPAAR